MESIYHYYAFISYATKDSKWAKWLQHQLSYYHIPTSVRNSQIGIPNKLRPIFIYEYDLAGNQLHKAIEQELTASKYLIVICSPAAAKSEYVNREVQIFLKQGRQNCIIPFVIDGEVDSKDSNKECLPPALLQLLHDDDETNDVRCANIATNGKQQALVDVVATMLGVRRDLLWNRYKTRQMKQRVAMIFLGLIAMLCGLFYWDYTRPTYEYFADYVDVNGIPTGVVPLKENQVSCRNGSYKFEKKRIPFGEPNAYEWRLIKVAYVNSAGTPKPIDVVAHSDRYSIQKLTYDSNNGVLTDITYCNEKEQPQIIHKISRNLDTEVNPKVWTKNFGVVYA